MKVKLPVDSSEEARICLECDLKKCCKNPLRCERYKEKRKTIKKKYNHIKRHKEVK